MTTDAERRDIHTYFGLTYSNYLVLHRTLLQSMPEDWQHRFVTVLEELNAAFRHIEPADCYQVLPAKECTYSDLDDADMKRLGITCSADDPEYPEDADTVYYDRDGTEHYPDAYLTLPCGDDSIPHYNRGRTRVEPNLAALERLAATSA
jgi:hypothetical protein